MKKYKVVKDTPFHKAGVEILENDICELYNLDELSCKSTILHFWSFFDEVKEPRFTNDTLPDTFIFCGNIYERIDSMYHFTSDLAHFMKESFPHTSLCSTIDTILRIVNMSDSPVSKLVDV